MNTKLIVNLGLFTLLATISAKELLQQQLTSQPFSAQAESIQDQISTRVFQKANPSVVMIKINNQWGSGFLISDDGLIITNAHVLEDGPSVATVKFSDGHQVSADVMGFAKGGVDLAVLRIYSQKKLPYLNLADSSSIKVGESVFAIGTPLNEEYQNSFTQGTINRIDYKKHKIQHSANINHGNSGGPLLNSQGDVVGINSNVDVSSPVYGSQDMTTNSGINFAISIDVLQNFIKDIQRGNISSVSTLNQANNISLLPTNGQPIQRQLSEKDCRPAKAVANYCDHYVFKAKAGQKVAVLMNSKEFEPLLVLFYLQEDGSFEPVLKSDQKDLGPGDFGAAIALEIPKDGNYLLLVSSKDPRQSGKYILRSAVE